VSAVTGAGSVASPFSVTVTGTAAGMNWSIWTNSGPGTVPRCRHRRR
jgi:hypothetical protein